jgi:hypothetical protein
MLAQALVYTVIEVAAYGKGEWADVLTDALREEDDALRAAAREFVADMADAMARRAKADA